MMRILLGGSFDPVHHGHLATAEAVRHLLHASAVTLLPAARSPFKQHSTADYHRLAMLRAALVDYPSLTLDERELHRPPPSYTVDTLRAVRQEIGPYTPLVWVMGSDTLVDLVQWKEWQSLTQLAHLLVVERANHQMPTTGAAIDWLTSLPLAHEVDQLQCCASGLWLPITLPPQPFSSTDIRRQLGQHHATTTKPEGLPLRVWQYILEHHLYVFDEIKDSP